MTDILSKREQFVVWLTLAGIIAVGSAVGNVVATVAIAVLIASLT
jgi:hypothetical protein